MKDFSNNIVVSKLSKLEEITWINKKEISFSEYEKNLPISDKQLDEAEDRLKRFAPFIKKAFPETEKSNGIIESPLEPILKMQKNWKKNIIQKYLENYI